MPRWLDDPELADGQGERCRGFAKRLENVDSSLRKWPNFSVRLCRTRLRSSHWSVITSASQMVQWNRTTHPVGLGGWRSHHRNSSRGLKRGTRDTPGLQARAIDPRRDRRGWGDGWFVCDGNAGLLRSFQDRRHSQSKRGVALVPRLPPAAVSMMASPSPIRKIALPPFKWPNSSVRHSRTGWLRHFHLCYAWLSHLNQTESPSGRFGKNDWQMLFSIFGLRLLRFPANRTDRWNLRPRSASNPRFPFHPLGISR